MMQGPRQHEVHRLLLSYLLGDAQRRASANWSLCLLGQWVRSLLIPETLGNNADGAIGRKVPKSVHVAVRQIRPNTQVGSGGNDDKRLRGSFESP